MDILDKKSEKELSKHRKNFYKKNIILRKKINIINEFSLNNLILNNNIFLIDINKFTTFEGQNVFNNPLIQTSIELIKNINIQKEKCHLYNYYKNFQPKTYGELYNLNPNNKIYQLKSTTIFFPWIHKNPTNKFKAGLFGPKDITNVEHRLIRLKNLLDNITKYNYLPSDNDIITGYILLKKDDFRFLVTGGHHRVAILSALNKFNDNYNKIMVKYETKKIQVKIVKEKDIKNWPSVKSGYIKDFDALEMFNSYF